METQQELPTTEQPHSSSQEDLSNVNVDDNDNDNANDNANGQCNKGVCGKANKKTFKQILISLLDCPVCFGYVMPPIMQCSRGHLICSKCRQKITVCPICRVPLSNIRNLAMEKVASELIFPCVYATLGCKLQLSFAERNVHEKDCDFKPYLCPIEKCTWKGGLKNVYKHLLSSHKNVLTVEGADIGFSAGRVLHEDDTAHWTMIQSCHGRHFLISLERVKIRSQYLAGCRIIGSTRDAAEFEYSMVVKGNNRELMWKSKPRSIRDASHINEDFLVLNKATVAACSKNGSLVLNVIIAKSESTADNTNN